MVLGASNYTYAEATLDQQLAAWLRCHETLGRQARRGPESLTYFPTGAGI
jgi:transposase